MRATPVRGARQGKRVGIPMGQFALPSYHYSYFWYRGFIYFNLGGVQWGLLHVPVPYFTVFHIYCTACTFDDTITTFDAITLSSIVGARCSISVNAHHGTEEARIFVPNLASRREASPWYRRR